MCVCVKWERPGSWTPVITCLLVKPQPDPLGPDPGPLRHISAHYRHCTLSTAAAPEKLLNVEDGSSAGTRFTFTSIDYVQMGRSPNHLWCQDISQNVFFINFIALALLEKMTFLHSGSVSSPSAKLAAAPPGGSVNSFPKLLNDATLSYVTVVFEWTRNI